MSEVSLYVPSKSGMRSSGGDTCRQARTKDLLFPRGAECTEVKALLAGYLSGATRCYRSSENLTLKANRSSRGVHDCQSVRFHSIAHETPPDVTPIGSTSMDPPSLPVSLLLQLLSSGALTGRGELPAEGARVFQQPGTATHSRARVKGVGRRQRSEY